MAAAGLLADPWFWLFGIPAVVLLGLAKGGFTGFGSLAMPIFVMAVPPVQGAAILLPILIVQDVVGVWSFRHSWDRHVIAVMLPGAVVGIALGYVFAASLPESYILGFVGLIAILFGAQRLWIERGGRAVPAQRLPGWTGTLLGAASGLTSQIAHAGGPPYQIWVLPRRLPRDAFVGTTAIFFAAMNWLKVPAFAALGEFTAPNMAATLALMPVAVLSALAGVRLVRRVPAERFYTLIYGLTVLLGVKLLWDAIV
jgi:hypothetical protein